MQSNAGPPQLPTFDLQWQREPIRFRPLRADDGPRLAAYFASLSEETRRLYHPHPFTAEHAELLCAQVGNEETIRMVAARDGGVETPFLAYVILDFALTSRDVRRYRDYGVELVRPILRIGPSVSDAVQGRGLGTTLLEAMIETARRLGCAHIILMGGVYTINERAIRFYEKIGLRKMGTYGDGPGPASWDMMMEL
jgi:GNAT superfamily N-acetyltransferase